MTSASAPVVINKCLNKFAAPRLRQLSTSASQIGAGSAQEGDVTKGKRLHWTFLLIPAAVSAYLGVWQVGRYQWKVEQVKEREAGLKGEPINILQSSERVKDYQRVICDGELKHERSILVGPRPRSVMGTTQAGYVLVTPLENEQWGSAVLVNRGWVPASWKTDAELQASGLPKGRVQIVGVTRSSEPRSSFVPDNNPAKGEWYWLEVPAMAKAAGLPPDAQMVQVISSEPQPGAARSSAPTSMELMALRTRTSSAEDQYPLPRTMDDLMAFSVMPNDHRNYALTWFCLSGATAVLALRAARLKK
ncbi:g4805 [Coccomyxa elongata]